MPIKKQKEAFGMNKREFIELYFVGKKLKEEEIKEISFSVSEYNCDSLEELLLKSWEGDLVDFNLLDLEEEIKGFEINEYGHQMKLFIHSAGDDGATLIFIKNQKKRI